MVYKQFYRFFTRSANCSLCGLSSERSGLCQTCQQAVMRQADYCQQCGHQIQAEQSICGYCLKKPPNYQKLIAACDYQFPIDKAINQLKFNRQLQLIANLSELLVSAIQDQYRVNPAKFPQALVPIPLHPQRLRQRGYNQSLLIAKQLSKHLSIPVMSQQLVRVKNTPHQIGLKAAQRRKNLNNAFHLKQTLPKHIALIDDVVTTGSTITEASRICRQNGVETIDIWCLAKT